MRTAIFLGLMMVADAIRGTVISPYSSKATDIIGFITVVVILMDIVDFFRDKKTA